MPQIIELLPVMRADNRGNVEGTGVVLNPRSRVDTGVPLGDEDLAVLFADTAEPLVHESGDTDRRSGVRELCAAVPIGDEFSIFHSDCDHGHGPESGTHT